MPWIAQVCPDVVRLRNVSEFALWGPLHRVHSPGCEGDADGAGCVKKRTTARRSVARRRDRSVRGRSVSAARLPFQARKLVAWECGAPTTRERLYIVMCVDGTRGDLAVSSHTRSALSANLTTPRASRASVFGLSRFLRVKIDGHAISQSITSAAVRQVSRVCDGTGQVAAWPSARMTI